MSSDRAIRAAAVAAMIFFVATTAFAQGPPPATCPADMAANDKRFQETIERLESVKNSTQAQKCAAYHSHVRTMKQSIPVFQRCTSGLTQRENVGQMNDSIGDFEEIIKRRC